MSSLLLFLSHLPTIGFLKAQKVCWFHRELGGVVLSSGRGRAATMLCKTESTVGRLPREKAGCSTTAWGGGKLEAGGTKQHGPWEGLISFPTLAPLPGLQNFTLCEVRNFSLKNGKKHGLIRYYLLIIMFSKTTNKKFCLAWVKPKC